MTVNPTTLKRALARLDDMADAGTYEAFTEHCEKHYGLGATGLTEDDPAGMLNVMMTWEANNQ